jgi:uncharacterized membrane protein YbhN (UPF0104 family)
LRPDDAAKITGPTRSTILILASLCAIFPIVYFLLSAILRARLRVFRWSFQLPKFRLALGQIVIGTINFVFVPACLHQTLSALGHAPYLKVATASITANIAAVISHVPGGLGVLEATIVHVLPGAQSIAAVIAFRIVSYFVPLAIGVPLLIGSEFLLRDKAPS